MSSASSSRAHPLRRQSSPRVLRRWTVMSRHGAAWTATVALLASGLSLAGAPAAIAAAPVGPAVTEADNLATSQAAARASGRRVRVESLLTDRATTWANPDGTLTQDVATRPVRVLRGGSWVDVDATLVSDGSGVHPVAVPVSTVLSNGGGQPFVTSDFGGGRSLKALWSTALPAPRLLGALATYADVQPGSDLLVRTSPVGYEFSLLVRERPTVPLTSISVPLQMTGLSASMAGLNVQFRDNSGVLAAQFLPPVMFDASGTDTVAPRSAPVQMSLSGSTLKLAVDTAFLADPRTQYPVTIDPTLSYGIGSDTYIQASNPSSNFNSSQSLLTGSTNGGSDRSRSLVSFNTTGVDRQAHPVGFAGTVELRRRCVLHGGIQCGAAAHVPDHRALGIVIRDVEYQPHAGQCLHGVATQVAAEPRGLSCRDHQHRRHGDRPGLGQRGSGQLRS